MDPGTPQWTAVVEVKRAAWKRMGMMPPLVSSMMRNVPAEMSTRMPHELPLLFLYCSKRANCPTGVSWNTINAKVQVNGGME